MTKGKQALFQVKTFQYRLILEGAALGIIAGIIVSLFRKGIELLEGARGDIIDWAHRSPAGIFVGLAMLAFCYLVSCLALRYAPHSGGSGIPQLKGEWRGLISQNWVRTLIAKVAATMAAIGAGLALGRGGPGIQIGAMTGKGFARIFKRPNTEEKLLMSCGAGAGFAGAFGAPLAGVLFTLEEIHRNFSTEVLLSTMAASITSDFVASNIFGLEPVFALGGAPGLTLSQHLYLLPLALLLGALGVCYNRLTDLTQNLYEKISNKYLRMAIPFALVIPVAVWCPGILGSGHHLVEEIATEQYFLGGAALLLLLRFVFSVGSYSSGVPGGIFLPLMVLGALAGGLYGEGMEQLFGLPETYVASFVIYGMVGLFSAIVRAPLTGVILITEMSGNFSNFLALNMVALLSYMTAELLRGRPIYDQLLDRLVSATGEEVPEMPRKEGAKQILIESDVYLGSAMDGRELLELALPQGSLVVSIQRDGRQLVPHGGTMLQHGDVLTIICRQEDIDRVQEQLDKKCRTVRA